ncbi:14246_t:CDS:2 [Acaulospora colombiana]|uniref:14246_t:CDS:1 n=1 Tax=Acaulospora colombiana TaxID=27376 RepID=A0ACA9N5W9_9GLOM|nr:14246_t:CDS:2 [Acaulospora colombiana]
MALNAYTIYGDPLVGQTQPKHSRTRSEEGLTIAEQATQLTNRAFNGSTFVPAQRTYDELGRPLDNETISETNSRIPSSANSVGDWYTSLQRTHSVTPQPAPTRNKGKVGEKSRIYRGEESPKVLPSVPTTQRHPRKPDWFRSSSSPAAIERPPLPSLAEMIRRDPPDPQNPLEPPVYYGIAPTNKGYEMLTKGGWVEGSSSSENSGSPVTISEMLQNRGQSSNRPLLTPIAVALKNDRKGLGLSKTRRLVTHSSLALHEHIQKGKAARRNQISKMRRLERDSKKGQYGRGKRAYAKMAKEDAAKRQRLMEYMNT